MQINHLYLIKDHCPRTPEIYRGDYTRILLHEKYTGDRSSYSVDKINRIFDEGINIDGLQYRIVSLLEGLQSGYDTGVYPGLMGAYKNATTEYPKRYEAVILGLTDSTLDKMAALRMHDFTTQEPDTLCADFVGKLRQHRDQLRATLIRNVLPTQICEEPLFA